MRASEEVTLTTVQDKEKNKNGVTWLPRVGSEYDRVQSLGFFRAGKRRARCKRNQRKEENFGSVIFNTVTI